MKEPYRAVALVTLALGLAAFVAFRLIPPGKVVKPPAGGPPVVEVQNTYYAPIPVDTDADGIPDTEDSDDDGDGIADVVDPTPREEGGDWELLQNSGSRIR